MGTRYNSRIYFVTCCRCKYFIVLPKLFVKGNLVVVDVLTSCSRCHCTTLHSTKMNQMIVIVDWFVC